MNKLVRITIATVLIIVMCFSFAGCKQDEEVKDTLVVGTEAMQGMFWTNDFGNAAVDRSIRDLIHGYNLIDTTRDGRIILDETTVVSDMQSSVDDETGDKTYTITLNEDLVWNDGTKLTAKDYVFTILLMSNPLWAASIDNGGMGVGNNYTYEAYEGWSNYAEAQPGENQTILDVAYENYFSGVKLISEYVFSVTVDASQLPYFYEIIYLDILPYPFHALTAKGATIISDENGSKLSQGALSTIGDILTTTRAEWEAPAVAYKYAPTVTCGPYDFISFMNQTVTLELNESYKGNFEGKKPTIKFIVQKYVNNNTATDSLVAGELDIVAGVIEGDQIATMKANPDKVKYCDYKRNGYGNVSFACDYGATTDVNVRTAIGYMLNREGFIQNILEGYGGLVEGSYGLASWMYQEKKDELTEGLVNKLAYDITKANQLLDQSDYKYQQDGTTPYVHGQGYRYNAQGEKLVIKHMGTVDNDVTNLLETQMKAAAPLVGMEYSVKIVQFNDLLPRYYIPRTESSEADRYNMFNLATGFTAVYDPYYSLHSKFIGAGMGYNPQCISDPELDRLVEELRRLDATQRDEYADIWVELQLRFNEVLPELPLYSNQYFDGYNANITGFNTTPFVDWAKAIYDMSFEADK